MCLRTAHWYCNMWYIWKGPIRTVGLWGWSTLALNTVSGGRFWIGGFHGHMQSWLVDGACRGLWYFSCFFCPALFSSRKLRIMSCEWVVNSFSCYRQTMWVLCECAIAAYFAYCRIFLTFQQSVHIHIFPLKFAFLTAFLILFVFLLLISIRFRYLDHLIANRMAHSVCQDPCGTTWGSCFQAILYHVSAAYLVFMRSAYFFQCCMKLTCLKWHAAACR